MIPSQAYETALALHQQGRLREAEGLYRAVLEAAPDHPAALHHLGVVQAQQGKLAAAIRLIRQAVEKEPRYAEAHNDLGVALESAKRHLEAVPCYERALALQPDYSEALFNLGNALQALERHDEAIMRFQAAVRLKPDHAEARNNLGKSLSALGRHEEALAQFARALASNPRYAEAEHNLGNLLHSIGRYREALAHSQRALALKPSHSKAHNSAGNSLRQLNRAAEAMSHYERAIALEPGYAEAHYNLGGLLKELGRRKEAVEHYERALELKPDLAEARFAVCMAQLPILYREEAEIAERRLAYQRQLMRLRDDVESGAAKGDLAEGLGSNLTFYLAYQGLIDRDLQSVYGALACRIMAKRYPPAHIADPPGSAERVRVGIVSGFFRQHSVWKISIKGWLGQLDRRRFQVFGYHTGVEQDAQTVAAGSDPGRCAAHPDLPGDRHGRRLGSVGRAAPRTSSVHFLGASRDQWIADARLLPQQRLDGAAGWARALQREADPAAEPWSLLRASRGRACSDRPRAAWFARERCGVLVRPVLVQISASARSGISPHRARVPRLSIYFH
jgi:tetratricopeptide (TPR) repeat protein